MEKSKSIIILGDKDLWDNKSHVIEISELTQKYIAAGNKLVIASSRPLNSVFNPFFYPVEFISERCSPLEKIKFTHLSCLNGLFLYDYYKKLVFKKPLPQDVIGIFSDYHEKQEQERENCTPKYSNNGNIVDVDFITPDALNNDLVCGIHIGVSSYADYRRIKEEINRMMKEVQRTHPELLLSSFDDPESLNIFRKEFLVRNKEATTAKHIERIMEENGISSDNKFDLRNDRPILKKLIRIVDGKQ